MQRRFSIDWIRDGFLWVSLFVTMVFGVLHRVPFVRSILLHFDMQQEDVLITALSFVVLTISLILLKVSKKLDLFSSEMDRLNSDLETKLIPSGTDGIYKEVNKELVNKKFDGKANKVIDIIGYTLFSVSPRLKQWKDMGVLKNITMNLCHLNIDFITQSSFIRDSWQNRLLSNLDEINSFINENKEYVDKNNVIINFYPYSHIPCIHGFKLTNGSMFTSFSAWDESRKIVQPNNSSYLHLKRNDKSDYAKELQVLFNNWLVETKGINA